MVNNTFSFKIKRQTKHFFPSDVKRTVGYRRYIDSKPRQKPSSECNILVKKTNDSNWVFKGFIFSDVKDVV